MNYMYKNGVPMRVDYGKEDAEVIDYCEEVFDPDITYLDRPWLIRGPKPTFKEPYFCCIGAAQTFGRYCKNPYPQALSGEQGMPALNLSMGGAGPAFFLGLGDKFFDYVNRSEFVVLQVMSGRSSDNSLMKDCGGFCTIDGERMQTRVAYQSIIDDVSLARAVVKETRDNWVSEYKMLIEKINVPVVLFWFSTRKPEYSESYSNVSTLFGQFPYLVNHDMVQEIRGLCREYIECVWSSSGCGYPHQMAHNEAARLLTRSVRIRTNKSETGL